MSSVKTSEPPLANSRATESYDQATFVHWNQYNQHPEGNQYPPPVSAQYPDNQYSYQPLYNPQGQVMTSVVTQSGVVPMVVNRTPYRDWMVPAVLSCLCCFWPTGICAIIAASNANQAAEAGDVIEAERQSRSARTHVIVSVILGIIVMFIVVLLTNGMKK